MKEDKAMKRKLMLLVGAISLLSACTVRGPEVKVRPPGVIVNPPVKVKSYDYAYPHRHPGPRHCPPGHAKKGWCSQDDSVRLQAVSVHPEIGVSGAEMPGVTIHTFSQPPSPRRNG
jgi:hypothetical protein